MVFKCLLVTEGLFSKILLGTLMCEDENSLINLETRAPGPTYLAFSSPQLLIFFVEHGGGGESWGGGMGKIETHRLKSLLCKKQHEMCDFERGTQPLFASVGFF